MKKRSLVCLIILTILILACRSGGISAYPTPDTVIGHFISKPALHDNDLYFGAGYCLYRLNLQDKNLNEIVCTENWTFQRPAVDTGHVYAQVLTSREARQFLVAFDTATDTVLWRADEPMGGAYQRSVKDHTILIGEHIIAVREEPRRRGQRICAFERQSGTRVWQTELTYIQSPLPFVVHDDLIWYVVDRPEDESQNGTVVGINADTGETEQKIDLRPLVSLDWILYVDDDWILGMEDYRYVVAVDWTRSGEVIWRSEPLASGSKATDQATLFGDLFVIPTGAKVYALDIESGQIAWTLDPGSADIYPKSCDNMVLIVEPSSGNETLYAIDVVSGTVVWKYQLASYDWTNSRGVPIGDYVSPRAVVDELTVYIPNKDSIDALDLCTGELLWQVEVNSQYEYVLDDL